MSACGGGASNKPMGNLTHRSLVLHFHNKCLQVVLGQRSLHSTWSVPSHLVPAGSTTSACGSGATPHAPCAATARTRGPPPRTAPHATPAQVCLHTYTQESPTLSWLAATLALVILLLAPAVPAATGCLARSQCAQTTPCHPCIRPVDLPHLRARGVRALPRLTRRCALAGQRARLCTRTGDAGEQHSCTVAQFSEVCSMQADPAYGPGYALLRETHVGGGHAVCYGGAVAALFCATQGRSHQRHCAPMR